MAKKLLILGSKGSAKKALEILMKQNDWDEIALLDNFPDADSVYGCPIIGKCDDVEQYRPDYTHAFACMAGCATRQRFLQKIAAAGYEIPNIIHPLAYVSSSATLGRGVFVNAFAAIQSECNIGDSCLINTGAVVEHDNVLDECVNCSPNATTTGGVKVGACSFLGAGCVVINNIKIGENVMVAAGAVVISDLPDNVMAAGCPAIVKKELQEMRFKKNQIL